MANETDNLKNSTQLELEEDVDEGSDKPWLLYLVAGIIAIALVIILISTVITLLPR